MCQECTALADMIRATRDRRSYVVVKLGVPDSAELITEED